MVTSVAAKLEVLLEFVPGKLRAFRQEDLITPRAPGKWSRLQILGHLCDSAINNLTRFIQAQYQPQPLVLIPYQQEIWVQTQRYADTPMEEVLTLWVSLNKSVLRVISDIPTEKLSYACILPDGSEATLQFLIEDYLEHMEHHLRQIFSDYDSAAGK